MSPTVWAVLPGGLWGLWLPAQEVAQGGSPAAQGVVRRHEPRKQAQRGHCKTNRDSTIPPARRAPSRRTAAPGVPWASSPASTLPAPTGGTGCERGTALSRSAACGAQHGSLESSPWAAAESLLLRFQPAGPEPPSNSFPSAGPWLPTRRA